MYIYLLTATSPHFNPTYMVNTITLYIYTGDRTSGMMLKIFHTIFLTGK